MEKEVRENKGNENFLEGQMRGKTSTHLIHYITATLICATLNRVKETVFEHMTKGIEV